jgi:hypothetical protein
MTDFKYTNIVGIIIAVNIWFGLFMSGMSPVAAFNFSTAAYCFCLFLHSFRQ